MSTSRFVSSLFTLVLTATLFLYGCGGGSSGSGSSGASVTGSVQSLLTIEVSPSNFSIAKGTPQSFTATGLYSDNTTRDLTDEVVWASQSPSVASISNAAGLKGRASSLTVGDVVISATKGTVTGDTTLTVTSATLISIGITPTDPTISLGTPQQFTATGVFTDNTHQDLTDAVEWESSDSSVATVSASGLAGSHEIGSTTILATLGDVTDAVTLTVTEAALTSIEISPGGSSVVAGMTRQFAATGYFTDNTVQDLTGTVAWESTDPFVATVDDSGLATSQGEGVTTIRASLDGVSDETSLMVLAVTLISIGVVPDEASIPKGLTTPFTAIGTYNDSSTQDITSLVAWSSSDTDVATISNAGGNEGTATGISAGTTTITASSGIVSGTAQLTVTDAQLVSIEITPANPSVARKTYLRFRATGTYSDDSTQDLTRSVTWASSNTNVATISNAANSEGLAYGRNAGTTTVTAALGDVTHSTTLTVTNASLVSLVVTPTNQSIPKGATLQYTATGTFSDSSTQDMTLTVSWSSSTKSVATISNGVQTRGIATAVSPGSTTIAAHNGNISNSTTLTVTGP